MGLKIHPWYEGHEADFICVRGEVLVIVKDLIVARYPIEGFRRILSALNEFITAEVEKDAQQNLTKP